MRKRMVGKDGIEPPTPGFSVLGVIGLYARVLNDLRLATPWPTSRRVAADCTRSRGVSDTLSDSGRTWLKGRATQDAGPNDESPADCRGSLQTVRKHHPSCSDSKCAARVRAGHRRLRAILPSEGLETRGSIPKGHHSPGLDCPARRRLQGGGVDGSATGSSSATPVTLAEQSLYAGSRTDVFDGANRHVLRSDASPRGTTRSESFLPPRRGLARHTLYPRRRGIAVEAHEA